MRRASAQSRALLGSTGDIKVAHIGSRAWVCHVEDGVSAEEARRRNLALVADALENEGIEYWVLDSGNRPRVTIGARQEDRARALAALRSVYARSAVYAGDLTRSAGRSRLVATLPDTETGTRGVRVFRVYLSSSGTASLGAKHACELEFWDTDEEDGSLVAPVSNRTAPRVPAADLIPAVLPVGDRAFPTLQPFSGPHLFDVTFPVDAVYTWVDGSDPAWRERKSRTMVSHGLGQLNEQAANDSRFTSRDELLYSLRSLEKFAGFIRNVFIVTDDQVPAWLNTAHERIRVVSHKEIFGDAGRLPTFNSHAIETRLHHIEGLAEHYLYLNDDMIFGRPVTAEKFFHANGLSKFFLSKAQLELGAPSPEDLPVMAAAKNNRDLIEAAFGRVPRNKFKHTPYPQQRSVLMELEEKYPEIFAETSKHQFRHAGDYAIPSSLVHYYAYMTGRAMPSNIQYTYLDLASPDTPARLRRLLARRDMDVFCVNDTDSGPEEFEAQEKYLSAFFDAYLPERGSFEL
ncbi:stealth conserved region 3 domain-containing protein [Streptomyces sp. NPDC093109]|uniref:stealth family protein n=1 Tax=Streptomyces sp. NPDC093109 TaxID=3154977 RepID=UPI00344FEFB9